MLSPGSTLQLRCIRGLLLAIGLATGVARSVGAPLFAAPFLSFDTGNNPSAVAIGDLNGDNQLDLVVTNTVSNTVSVLLGGGDGSFGARADFGTGGNPVSVAIRDLNSDGKRDLVVANYNSSSVSVLLGS